MNSRISENAKICAERYASRNHDLLDEAERADAKVKNQEMTNGQASSEKAYAWWLRKIDRERGSNG